jgi:predicted RNA-binding protein with RPS1 domain
MLFMSDAVATTVDEVPTEVEALDGVASESEAHNVDRPARGSGIHKHSKGKKPPRKGTPLSELQVGASVEGKIKTTTAYGAFVDIGAMTDALLHVSRLSDNFVAKVEDIVKAGDVVTVRIVSVDVEKNQVAVSMKSEEAEAKSAAAREQRSARAANTEATMVKRKERPQRSGGDREAQAVIISNLVESGYDSDKMIEGEVVSMLDFGAFVRFDASQLANVVGELDGLVHISALCVGRAESVASVVSVGQKVHVRVKSIEKEGNKISLSMISKSDEESSRPAPKGASSKSDSDEPRKRSRQMFSESDMGAKDWKESFEKFQGDQPSFSNTPLVVDRRR